MLGSVVSAAPVSGQHFTSGAAFALPPPMPQALPIPILVAGSNVTGEVSVKFR
jgi:hypothetical protein